MKIPKIIHQIWIESIQVPENIKKISQSWIDNNPSWRYEFWDKKRINDFLRDNYPNIKSHNRIDIAQFFILKHYGGVYVGIDFESIEPIEPLVYANDCYLTYVSPNADEISDTFVACVPSHPFLDFIINNIYTEYNNKIWSNNITSLTDYYKIYSHKSEISILDSKYLYPCSKNEIARYKSGHIPDEEMENKLWDAVAICHFLIPENNKLSSDILYISTGNGSGGAWIAAHRIHSGLRKIGLESKMFVKQSSRKESADIIVASHSDFNAGKAIKKEPHTIRRSTQFIRNVLFSASLFGIDLEKYLNLINPKIVQLHCINWGFLTIEDLKLINTPIVWRLPDVWAFTGGCHYFGNCDRYTDSCGECPLLRSSEKNDISHQIWNRKKEAWKDLDMTIVVPTYWMKDIAKKSSLFKDLTIEVIPNGLEIDLFSPLDKEAARKILKLPLDKRIILYGANDAVNDPRKGFSLLQAALKDMDDAIKRNCCLVIFGADVDNIPNFKEISDEIGMPMTFLGYIREHLVLQMAYSAADVMIVPSLEEAFGQTVIESMACGTPVVSFEETGPASIIDHKQNGYLARYKDIQDLKDGIAWTLSAANKSIAIFQNARTKVENVYDIRIVAQQYKTLYERLLNNRC